MSVPVQGTSSVDGSATFNGADSTQANNTFGVTIQIK